MVATCIPQLIRRSNNEVFGGAVVGVVAIVCSSGDFEWVYFGSEQWRVAALCDGGVKRTRHTHWCVEQCGWVLRHSRSACRYSLYVDHLLCRVYQFSGYTDFSSGGNKAAQCATQTRANSRGGDCGAGRARGGRTAHSAGICGNRNGKNPRYAVHWRDGYFALTTPVARYSGRVGY